MSVLVHVCALVYVSVYVCVGKCSRPTHRNCSSQKPLHVSDWVLVGRWVGEWVGISACTSEFAFVCRWDGRVIVSSFSEQPTPSPRDC